MILPIAGLALLVGVGLLVADMLNRLRVDERRVRWWRAIAAIAALFVGLQPVVFGLRTPEAVMYPFHLVAIGYLAAAATFLAGLVVGDGAAALWLRRIGYGVLLLLGALPSLLLLFLTPVIALAGIGLARPASEVVRRGRPA